MQTKHRNFECKTNLLVGLCHRMLTRRQGLRKSNNTITRYIVSWRATLEPGVQFVCLPAATHTTTQVSIYFLLFLSFFFCFKFCNSKCHHFFLSRFFYLLLHFLWKSSLEDALKSCTKQTILRMPLKVVQLTCMKRLYEKFSW